MGSRWSKGNASRRLCRLFLRRLWIRFLVTTRRPRRFSLSPRVSRRINVPTALSPVAPVVLQLADHGTSTDFRVGDVLGLLFDLGLIAGEAGRREVRRAGKVDRRQPRVSTHLAPRFATFVFVSSHLQPPTTTTSTRSTMPRNRALTNTRRSTKFPTNGPLHSTTTGGRHAPSPSSCPPRRGPGDPALSASWSQGASHRRGQGGPDTTP